MKKIITFCLFIILLYSCDDGDLTIQGNFNFSNATPQYCTLGNYMYQINENEILLLQIPFTNFRNEVTPENEPRVFNLSGTNRAIYRVYNGNINANAICSAIAPTTPIVTEEWIATSGQIVIKTIENKTIDEATNSSRITGYTHIIRLENAQFVRPDDNLQIVSINYGTFITSATAFPDFTTLNITRCGTNTQQMVKIASNQALQINLNEPLPLEAGVTQRLINNNNTLAYKIFDGNLAGTFFCTNPEPTLPVLQEQWNAEEGVVNESGIIEINTTLELDFNNNIVGRNYEITLKKIRLRKGSIFFDLGNTYNFGITTVNN